MTINLRSKSLLRGVAAVAAAGAVAGTVVLAGVGTASADTDTLTLNYSCNFPDIPDQTLVTTITVNLPTSIPQKTQTGAIAIGAAVQVPAQASSALVNLIGAATIGGTASAGATINVPGSSTPIQLSLALNIPQTAIPQDGSPFTVNATGSAPSIQFANAGTGSVDVAPVFTTSLDPKDSTGADTSLGTFASTCNLTPATQNTQLATFTVTPAGGGGGTTTTTTTTTTPVQTTTTTPVQTTTTTTTPVQTTTTTTTPVQTTTTTPVQTTTTSGGGGGGDTTNLSFNVNGTTHIQALGASLNVGPGTLNITLNTTTGALTGPLTLANNTVSFNLFGFVPGTAAVQLIPAAPVTGTFKAGVVNVTASETVRLSTVTVYGIPIVSNSTTCQTATPASIPLVSSAGFSPLKGGTLTGTYTLPALANNGCGSFFTPFINLFAQGSGNTISVNVTPAS